MHQSAARKSLHEPDVEGLKQTKRGEPFQARIVSYADDFVILSRGHAQEALGSARGALG